MANSNNVQNVKFLRNGSLFATREAARTALETNKTLGLDGSAILARYSGGTVGDESFFIKTLVGFVYADNANTAVTIFDIDDAGTDAKEYVDSLVGSGITSANTATAQLEALSGTSSDASGVTSVWGAKAYTDGKIDGLDVAAITAPAGAFIKSVSQSDGKVSATTEYMPTVSAISAEGKAITAVSQSNGTISATPGDIAAAHVSVDDSSSLLTATTVEGALAEIAAEIDAMDLIQVGDGNGKVIIAVSEQDGKVSASATSVSDLTLEGFEANTATTGAVTSADTIEAAINKLENKAAAITVTPKDKSIVVETTGATTEVGVNIRSGERVLKLDTDATSGGVYTALDLVKITNDLPAEIKERYQFKASDGSVIGANIDIPKDSHIVSITYITTGEHAQNLEYKYVDVSGNTQTTYVDMSSLIIEAEFASGVTFSDGVAHGVVDSDSEKDESEVAFLTVGTNGFKISGIKGAIDTKINKLNADLSGNSTHVTVGVVEANGKITTVTVAENDIASATALTKEISDREAADTELSNRLGTGVTTANTATAQLAALVGTTADTKDSSSIVGAKKYADDKVATIVDGLDATVTGETANKHITISIEELDGKLVQSGLTITESDIASASALTAEIAARKAVDGQSGQTYAANANANYISGANSLNDADVKLDVALKVADDAMLTGVAAGNGILVSNKSGKSQTISAVVNRDGGIVVDNTGLHLGYIDCGTY